MNVGTNGTTETGDEDEDDDEDSNEGLLYACSLQHLPPITLTCLLPRSYPSTRAPYFVIAAKWLDEPEVSRFCSVLDEIWAELPGQEVVYRWADWLSGSSWLCIASDGQMVLGPDASSAAADGRAIGRSLILDSTIPLMHRYSEERSREAFDRSVHECGVCLSENTGARSALSSLLQYILVVKIVENFTLFFHVFAGINFIQLPCNHSFCVKCMESYCGIHVKEGSVTTLACPDTSCRAPLPPPVLRCLLAEEGYARWESLALRRTLDTMPDVVYCPRCNAACVAAGDDAQCAACFFTFCARCGDRRHVGGACVSAEDKLDALLVRCPCNMIERTLHIFFFGSVSLLTWYVHMQIGRPAGGAGAAEADESVGEGADVGGAAAAGAAEGGGAPEPAGGAPEHEAVPVLPDGHRQDGGLQQDGLPQLRPVLLLPLQPRHQRLQALRVSKPNAAGSTLSSSYCLIATTST
jgi:hypothetical protein